MITLDHTNGEKPRTQKKTYGVRHNIEKKKFVGRGRGMTVPRTGCKKEITEIKLKGGQKRAIVNVEKEGLLQHCK